MASKSFAQGGPPFRTDDPETPGNRHWEINFGWIGDRNLTSGAYQIPDLDLNYGLGDRIQLKYELPLALSEIRPQPSTATTPAQTGQVLGGLGESLLGVKWRFFERHPSDPWLSGRFGTGLRDAFGHAPADAAQSAGASGDAPGAADAPEQRVTFSLSTYPQLFLNNPTRSVQRGLVAAGPSFLLPLEINGRLGPLRLDMEAGYNFGNHTVPQTWIRGLILGHEFSDQTEVYAELYDQQDANRVPQGRGVGVFATAPNKQRETTLGLGGRQALNPKKTLNLLLMGGRTFQTSSVVNSQPVWVAYIGLQVLLGPHARDPGTGSPH